MGCYPLASYIMHANVVQAVKKGRRAGMAGDRLGMGDMCLTRDGASSLPREGLGGAEGKLALSDMPESLAYRGSWPGRQECDSRRR